jgi:RimJ/RimL family protein N-acetyltransferase
MPITLSPMVPATLDREGLVAFLTRNEFPFHVRPRWSRQQVEAAIDEGSFQDDDNESRWIDHAERGRVGFVRFENLTEAGPLFDLRLDSAHRGAGLAAGILRAATDHVFTTMPTVTRFEGQTRQDNIAMRRVFLRCGWVKEAHYRDGWPVEGGSPLASVAYGILRRDWESGRTTPVDWDDLTL